jgi:hypothetical protein
MGCIVVYAVGYMHHIHFDDSISLWSENDFDSGISFAVHLYKLGNGVVDLIFSERLDTYSPCLVEDGSRLG